MSEYRVGSVTIFQYDSREGEPGDYVYIGCTLLCNVPAECAHLLQRGHWHRDAACRRGAVIGRIAESGDGRLVGYDDENCRILEVYRVSPPTDDDDALVEIFAFL